MTLYLHAFSLDLWAYAVQLGLLTNLTRWQGLMVRMGEIIRSEN